MSDNPLGLTRNQIAAFMPNARGVRVFEQLIKQVDTISTGDLVLIRKLLEEVTIDSSTSGARATQAISAINRLADALDSLALAPPRQIDTFTKTDYVDFDTLPPEPTYAVGRMWWNANGTLNLGMGGGNITQQVGEEAFVYGKATAAITEGQLVMLTGAVGASGVVTFAPTTAGLLDPNLIVGVATENIPNNGFGRVTTFGTIHGIDTTGSGVGEVWVDGDLLWYRTGGAGTMTKVRPTSPNMKTAVALVINAGGGGSGSLQVQLVRGSALGVTDSNVEITSPADKQILQYDNALSYWKNVSRPAFSSTASVGGATPAVTGAGITFPSTVSLSSDAFTLDDYREVTYTPTATPTSGTFTTASAIGSYTRIGRQMFVTVTLSITTNGTAAGAIDISLPLSVGATYSHAGCGRETAVSGKMLQGITSPGFSSFRVFNYDGTYPGGNGTNLVMQLTYFT